MKSIARVTAVRRGICERVYYLVEFCNRARPAMGNYQRKGIRLWAPAVNKVNIDAVDCGDEKAYMRRREEAMKAALAKRDAIGDPFAGTRRM